MKTTKDICDYLIASIKMRLNSVYGIRIMSIYERCRFDSLESINYRNQCKHMEFLCTMDCIAIEMIERGMY